MFEDQSQMSPRFKILNGSNWPKIVTMSQVVVAETITEVGNPKEAICEAVEKHKIQMLLLGSHSRGAIKRLASVLWSSCVI